MRGSDSGEVSIGAHKVLILSWVCREGVRCDLRRTGGRTGQRLIGRLKCQVGGRAVSRTCYGL